MPGSVCYLLSSQPEELITPNNKSHGLEMLFRAIHRTRRGLYCLVLCHGDLTPGSHLF